MLARALVYPLSLLIAYAVVAPSRSALAQFDTPGVPTESPVTTASPDTTVSPGATTSPTPMAVCDVQGDCNGDGEITISDIIAMVAVALGDPTAACPGFEGEITVDEIMSAINASLGPCGPVPATPLPTTTPIPVTATSRPGGTGTPGIGGTSTPGAGGTGTPSVIGTPGATRTTSPIGGSPGPSESPGASETAGVETPTPLVFPTFPAG